MLSFRQFRQMLYESSWDKYLYHATYGDFDPKNIKPGSHFETLHAAMSRAKDQIEGQSFEPTFAQKMRKKLKVYAFKYNTKGNGKEVEDKGSKNYIHYPANGEYGSKLKSQGITHLTYKNKVEDEDFTSQIIYDPENLEHVHTFKKPKFATREYKTGGHRDWPGSHYFDVSKKTRQINNKE